MLKVTSTLTLTLTLIIILVLTLPRNKNPIITLPLTLCYQRYRRSNWRANFQNLINPLLMKIELTSLHRITLELSLVTEWNLDPDNSRKHFFFKSKFCFPIDMCINSVKETCFSQKYQKWICQVLEINSSIVTVANVGSPMELVC